MLICVGGIPGSGRKNFARRIASETGFYLYDLEGLMRSSLLMLEYARVRDRHTIPDALRLRMFRQAARNFEEISRVFKHVIVDEPFHRMMPRAYLFDEGKKHFGRVEVVWVTSSLTLEERVRGIMKKNPRLTTRSAQAIIEQMDWDFETFSEPPTLAVDVLGNREVLDRVINDLGL